MLQNASVGKLERLKYVSDILGLKSSPPNEIRYQLLHRSAAAVVEAQRFKTDNAAMIVQSFSQEHRWFEDFAAFANLFGLEPLRGKGLTYILPSGKEMTLGWATGSTEFL